MRLLTNNPDKTASLEGYGVTVAERVALTPRPNDHNLAYLLTKRDRMGHQLDGSAATRRAGADDEGAHRMKSGSPTDQPRATPASCGWPSSPRSWHEQVMDGLLAGAQRALRGVPASRTGPSSGCPAPSSCPWSPRRWPRQGYDAVVALGVVIRGGTPHFDYVCSAATDGPEPGRARHRRRRSASGCSPATPRSRRSTAPACRARSEDKGYEATAAALATALTLRPISAGVWP